MKAHYSYPLSPSNESEVAAELKAERKMMAEEESRSPAPIIQASMPSAIRRSRSPPKNEEGGLICDHPDCQDKSEIFRRVCEWNKHMDRHERPYKCNEPGCELTPGFTYSGGLLRHQREVHKMHLSTKQPLFCPIPNCNRSSGVGFTRKENLEEHKRRRHVGQVSESARSHSSPLATSPASQKSDPQINTKKRKRSQSHLTDEPEKVGLPHVRTSSSEMETEHPLVKYLRLELAQKDDFIKRQALEIQRLQNLIQSLPTQTIYGVLPATVPHR